MLLTFLLYYGIILTPIICLPDCSDDKQTECYCDTYNNDNNICYTSECWKFAHDIQQNIDNSKNPCIDFYEYGCGNWDSKELIEGLTRDPIEYKTYNRIHELLLSRNKPDEPSFIRKAKQFHRSCMNEKDIENEGLRSIKVILNRVGGWPILMSDEEWYANDLTWQSINHINYLSFGFSSFYNLEYRQDVYGKNSKIILIKPFITSLIDETLRDDIYRCIYIDTMTKVVLAFVEDKRLNISAMKLRRDVEAVMQFHINFRQIVENGKEIKNAIRMKLSELQAFYNLAGNKQPTGEINWINTIRSIFYYEDIHITTSQFVLIHDRDFLHKLAHLLNSTSLHVIVNYVLWNIVIQSIPQLNRQIRNIKYEYNLKYDIIRQDKRWLTCVKNFPMKDIASYIFIKKYISTETLKTVSEMVDEIKAELIESISHSYWMHNVTKNHMLNRINKISAQIGYPKEYENPDEFFKRYEELKFDNNYFANWLAFKKYELKRILKGDFDMKEGTSKSANVWPIYPIEIKASYNDEHKVIIIPAALIQSPYFTCKMPIASNYGAIGSIIGHVLSHSFQWYNIDRNDKSNEGIIIMADRMIFKGRIACYIERYNTYIRGVIEKDGKPVKNGRATVEENIADFIGIKAAFTAFQKKQEKLQMELKLPLLNVTDEQLFFLSFTNLMCSSARNTYITDFINTFVHSPGKYRINGCLANMAHFSEAFKCHKNSPMNPELKCVIWGKS